jgi:uncharacterized membrane protein (DUF485 family)
MRDAEVRHRRLGNWLFLAYLVLYVTFVLLNAFEPEIMERQVFKGLNLALVSGLGLIIIALLLAVIHGSLAPRPSATQSDAVTGERR